MAASPETERLRAIPINEDDVSAFFDEKKVRLECELCGEVDWALSLEYQVNYLPTILATCRNCGNMRLHNRIVFQLWKQGRATDEQR